MWLPVLSSIRLSSSLSCSLLENSYLYRFPVCMYVRTLFNDTGKTFDRWGPEKPCCAHYVFLYLLIYFIVVYVRSFRNVDFSLNSTCPLYRTLTYLRPLTKLNFLMTSTPLRKLHKSPGCLHTETGTISRVNPPFPLDSCYFVNFRFNPLQNYLP